MALSKPQYAASYLEEMLECSVCLDTVKEPYILKQCFHTFCKLCVDEMMENQNNDPAGITCPQCRSFSGTDDIRHNFFIDNLAQLHRSVLKGDHKECEHCKGKHGTNEATWVCLDCAIALCDICKDGHVRIKMLQDHRIVSITSEEATNLVIDLPVFCTVHEKTTIEFFCKTCNIPICIKCRLTTHDDHKSETIEIALKRIVPEIEEKAECIEGNIATITTSISETDAKIKQTQEMFSTCCNKVIVTAVERINQIKMDQKKLLDQFKQEERHEIKKLEITKEKLEQKRQERENFKRFVLMSLDKARNATLLNELVQGGMQNKMQKITTKDPAPCLVNINLPNYVPNQNDWNKMMQNGLLGKMHMHVGARHWPTTFKEFFSKPMKQKLEIKLPGQCTKLSIIDEYLWASNYNGSVGLYSKAGELIRKINIATPTSAEQAYNGDIFIACDKGSGLHVITDNDNLVKLSHGSFSHVCCFMDRLYALDCQQNSVIEYCYVNESAEKKQWKEARRIHLKNYELPSCLDTLLVTNESAISGMTCFYVSSWNKKTIYKFTEQGVLVKQYGNTAQNWTPCICGVDILSHILVAGAYDKSFKILDPESSQWSETGLIGQTAVYDARLDSDGSIWLSQWNGTNFIVTKHSN